MCQPLSLSVAKCLVFRVNYQQEDLGVMDRDAIAVLLIARPELNLLRAGFS
jgi:hypothetical protein